MQRAKFTKTVREGMAVVLDRAKTTMSPAEKMNPAVSRALDWMDYMKEWKSKSKPPVARRKAKKATRRRAAAK